MIEILILLAGFFVAWNLGANNAANCIGVSVGSRIFTYRSAIAIVIIFVLAGALLQGYKDMRTVADAIVLAGPAGVNPLSAIPYAALASLLATGVWMFLATMLGLPMSVSQSSVGAVLGAGLLITVTRPGLGVGIQYGELEIIGISWILAPLIAALVALIVFKVIGTYLRHIKDLASFNRTLTVLIFVASAYTAYVLGANDVGASVGVIYAFFGGSALAIALLGAVAVAVGAATFSRRVILTVGSGIAEIDPTIACAAQFGAALSVWSFVQFGIPVSTSAAIIGGIAGAGLLKGRSTVSGKRMGQVVLALVVAPLVAGVLSFAIGALLLG